MLSLYSLQAFIAMTKGLQVKKLSMLVFIDEETLCIEGGAASCSGGTDGLAISRIGAVAGGKNAIQRAIERAVGADIL